MFKMAPCPLSKTCRGKLKHAGIRVSADTKTCGSPLNSCHFYGGLYYTKPSLHVQYKSNFFAKNWVQGDEARLDGETKNQEWNFKRKWMHRSRCFE
jgi:hypothetical protein